MTENDEIQQAVAQEVYARTVNPAAKYGLLMDLRDILPILGGLAEAQTYGQALELLRKLAHKAYASKQAIWEASQR